MKNVGCDRAVDVDERKIFPEYTLNGFDSHISACFGEFHGSFVNRIESFNDLLRVVRLKVTFPVTDVLVWCRADGTIPIFDQCNQRLLWIITHIGSENWITPSHSAISTDQEDSIMSDTLHWLDYVLHAVVEEVGQAATT